MKQDLWRAAAIISAYLFAQVHPIRFFPDKPTDEQIGISVILYLIAVLLLIIMGRIIVPKRERQYESTYR